LQDASCEISRKRATKDWRDCSRFAREGIIRGALYLFGGTSYYKGLSNGNGTFAWTKVDYPTGSNFGLPSSYSLKTGDFNGDGATDVLRVRGPSTAGSTGLASYHINTVNQCYKITSALVKRPSIKVAFFIFM